MSQGKKTLDSLVAEQDALRCDISFAPPTFGDVHLASKDLYIYVMSPLQRVFFQLLVAFWYLGLVIFYVWWFRAEHVVDWFFCLINTLLVTWTIALPGYFFFIGPDGGRDGLSPKEGRIQGHTQGCE